jgi:glutamate-1-semialdehyde 2,1-aminomutase
MSFDHGRGGRCWSAEGDEYIDLVCGYGPVVLGHAHAAVTQAVCEELARGTLLPGPTPTLDRLRGRLLELFPHHEGLLTFKTGSEAVAAAIRLARATTGREKVIRVGFHGWHDAVVSPYVSCHVYEHAAFKSELPPGIPHMSFEPYMTTWHGADMTELEALIRATGSDLAALVIDPVQISPPFAERASRLQSGLRNVGALLILDESKTGFRVDLGGVQALHGVRADITILGKALANGLPLAVVLGRAETIALAGPARIKGTFASESTALAAALATIDVLTAEDGPRVLAERGSQLIDGLSKTFRHAGLEGEVTATAYHWACLPYVVFAWNSARAQRLQDPFYIGLREEGVLMLRDHMSYVSLAHSDADIDAVVAAAERVIERIGHLS